jgi:hypothetical protein
MGRLVIQFLLVTCLIFSLAIPLAMLASAMKMSPPPVPLDPEGHMAPYYESPFPI